LNIKILALTLALVPPSVATASATELRFSLTGPDLTLTFDLAETPVVSKFTSGDSFEVAGYTFYRPGGGFTDTSGDTLFGPLLYDGSESNPTFLRGDFELADAVSIPGSIPEKLTISAIQEHSPVPVVPELSTWAMMLVGFAGLGFARYRRGKIVTPAA
jgi:hypothetical protein